MAVLQELRRLNVSILSDEGVIKELKQSLREYFQLNDNGEITPSVLWEAGKAVLNGKMIEITSRLKKARLEQQRELDSKIKQLESEHKRTSKKSILCELKEFRQKPDELLTQKAEGALRFIGQRCYEMVNRTSWLLTFQLSRAQTNKIVSKIQHPTSN